MKEMLHSPKRKLSQLSFMFESSTNSYQFAEKNVILLIKKNAFYLERNTVELKEMFRSSKEENCTPQRGFTS